MSHRPNLPAASTANLQRVHVITKKEAEWPTPVISFTGAQSLMPNEDIAATMRPTHLLSSTQA
jgi:hypothetical protein